jgi:hypothetical protein
MNIKSLLAKPFANVIYRQIQKERHNALQDQQIILNLLYYLKDKVKVIVINIKLLWI